MRKKKSHKGKIVLIVILLLLIGILLGSIFYIRSMISSVGNGDKQEVLVIEQGESFQSVLDHLEEMDLIHDASFASLYVKLKGNVSYYAGNYTLNDGMNLDEILEYLSDSNHAFEDSVSITIPEGKWAKEIAEILSQNFDYSQQEIIDYWNNEDTLKALCNDYEFLNFEDIHKTEYKIKLEGYLFPETYSIPTDASIDEITRILLNQFNKMYQEYKEDFNQSEYSVHEIVTLASVVQFESGYKEDMPTIAGVFYNRLNNGMRMQSSVTVCYALYDDFSDPTDCEVQTDIDSPYNTYLYDGLPIGPILNAGKDAFEATLHPEENDYFYFAADIHGDGKVYYSKTFEEHQQICDQLNLGL
ncbi:MAG: endolytic transglycosylase MltG [Floccifex sp.]